MGPGPLEPRTPTSEARMHPKPLADIKKTKHVLGNTYRTIPSRMARASECPAQCLREPYHAVPSLYPMGGEMNHRPAIHAGRKRALDGQLVADACRLRLEAIGRHEQKPVGKKDSTLRTHCAF